MTTKKKTLIIVLYILYIALVAYLCFGKFDDLGKVSRTIWGIPTDKVVHFIMFFPFPILSFLVFSDKAKKPWHSLLLAICVFVAGCVLAGATEIGQTYLPYRTGDFMDFKADAISMAISTIIMFIIDLGKQFKHEK